MYKKDFPDHHDAELVIKLYDLRREAVMRESRHAINRTFWPASFEDITAITTNPEHPLNAPYRQLGTYWEMVYGMAKHGIIHADFLLESSGEGIFLFARVAPWLAQIREVGSPKAFANAEWVTTQTASGRELMTLFTGRVQKALAARAASR